MGSGQFKRLRLRLVRGCKRRAHPGTGPQGTALLSLLLLTGSLVAGVARAQTEPPVITTLRTWVVAASDLPWSEASPATHGLRLTLVVLHETPWHADSVLAAMKRMAPLFAPCGVRIVAAEVRLIDAPPRFRNYETQVSRELARRLPLPRPTVYFVADTLNRPAFDAEAIGRSNSGSRPELADTVWVAAGTRDLHIVLAHELAHVLMDSGAHSGEPHNLMQTETTPENTRLTETQCARMRATAEHNGLLTPSGN